MAWPYQSEIFPESTPQPDSLRYGETGSSFPFQNPAVAPNGFVNQFANWLSPYWNYFRAERLGNSGSYQAGLIPTSTRSAQNSRLFPTMTPTPEQMEGEAQDLRRLPPVSIAGPPPPPPPPAAQFNPTGLPQRKQYFLPSVYRYDEAQNAGPAQMSPRGASSAYPFSYMGMPDGTPDRFSSSSGVPEPATINMPQGALPLGWTNKPSWTWSPGGQDAFYGVPDSEMDTAVWGLGAQLPWAQMYYANQARAFEEDMLRRQFEASRLDAGFNQNLQSQDFARQGDQFDRQFGASREDAAFNQWLQSQDFARQGDQFDRQFGASREDAAFNQWLQSRDFARQGDQFDRQFGASREDARWNQGFQDRQFDASRDDAMWNRGFQDRQLNSQNSQFDRQFDASRDDAMWNRGFQEKQFDSQNDQWGKEFDFRTQDWRRQGDQWNQQFAAGRDDAMWNRGMQEKDWNRSGQQWQDQFTQQSNQWRNEFDFQKKNAEEQNRLAEQAQYVGAFGRRFAPAVGSM